MDDEQSGKYNNYYKSPCFQRWFMNWPYIEWGWQWAFAVFFLVILLLIYELKIIRQTLYTSSNEKFSRKSANGRALYHNDVADEFSSH